MLNVIVRLTRRALIVVVVALIALGAAAPRAFFANTQRRAADVESAQHGLRLGGRVCVRARLHAPPDVYEAPRPHGLGGGVEAQEGDPQCQGLTVYTFGVTNTSLDQAENRKLFKFAKLMGIKVIVVEPRDFRILDLLEQLVKEYDIKIAIHNHGIKTLYGNPLVVKTLIGHRDPRIGVCLDVGWVTAAGFDAAKIFKDYGDRVFDLHLKDKRTERTAGGDDVYLDVRVGTGQANYAGLLAEMKAANWNGVMAIETDNADFAKDPTAFALGARFHSEDGALSLRYAEKHQAPKRAKWIPKSQSVAPPVADGV